MQEQGPRGEPTLSHSEHRRTDVGAVPGIDTGRTLSGRQRFAQRFADRFLGPFAGSERANVVASVTHWRVAASSARPRPLPAATRASPARASLRPTPWSWRPACRSARDRPGQGSALAAGRDGHVATDQERQPAEHPLLAQSPLRRQQCADPLGQVLVVGHGPSVGADGDGDSSEPARGSVELGQQLAATLGIAAPAWPGSASMRASLSRSASPATRSAPAPPAASPSAPPAPSCSWRPARPGRRPATRRAWSRGPGTRGSRRGSCPAPHAAPRSAATGPGRRACSAARPRRCRATGVSRPSSS